jgi:hypothetical protein
MEELELSIDGLLLITPWKSIDEGGFVSETYNARNLKPHIGNLAFVQDNHSLSHLARTVRVLHFQARCAEGKLVRVARGNAYDVAVDVRHGSPTFGRHVGVELNAANWAQLGSVSPMHTSLRRISVLHMNAASSGTTSHSASSRRWPPTTLLSPRKISPSLDSPTCRSTSKSSRLSSNSEYRLRTGTRRNVTGEK